MSPFPPHHRLSSGGAAPGPVELGALLPPEEVGRHRQLSCRLYTECLDTAYRRRWRSFSCAACAATAPAPDPELDSAHAGAMRPGAT